jgi:hypothetical protein
MSFLSILLNGYNTVNLSTVELPQRNVLNFTGTGVTASDNPTTGATDITITSGTGSALTALTADVIATGPGVGVATVQAIRGRTVASTTPSDAALLVYDSPTSTWNPRLIHGDATLDSAGLLTVVGIQGYPVSTDAPISGDVLAWNTGGFWEPNGVAGGGITQLTGVVTAGPGSGTQATSYASGDFGTLDVHTDGDLTVGTDGGGSSAVFGGGGTDGFCRVGTRIGGAASAALWLMGNGGTPSGSNYTLLCNGAALEINAISGGVYLEVGGNACFTAATSANLSKSPIHGDSSAWGSVNGTATQAMGDADQTLAASKYKCTRLITTGGITADRTAIYPVATDDEGYRKVITNNCTSGGPYGLIVASGANPATVLVGLAKTCEVWIDSNGVTRLTADI